MQRANTKHGHSALKSNHLPGTIKVPGLFLGISYKEEQIISKYSGQLIQTYPKIDGVFELNLPVTLCSQ